jgi:glycine cleavage system H lipoate-binding protein
MFALGAIVAVGAQAKAKPITGPIKFTAESKEAFLELEGGAGKVTCKASKSAGEITTPTSGTVIATFTGCETEGKKCNSKGQAAGTIVTEPLKTVAGYINKAKGEAGTSFEAASGSKGSGYNAIFDCPGTPNIENRVKGSVIGRIEPANVMSTTSKSVLKNNGGKQEIEKFEGAEKDTLISEIFVEGKKYVEVGGVQNQTSEVFNTPVETKKGKKVKQTPDPAELKTGGATPEYGRCEAKKKGKYTDGNCQTVAPPKKGKYEWYPV